MPASNVIGRPFGFGSGVNAAAGPSAMPLPGVAIAPTVSHSLEIPIPDIFPPRDGIQFNPQGTVTSSAVEGPLVIPGSTVVIPPSTWIRIASLNLQIDNMLLTTNVLWTLLYNGNPLPGFVNMPIFPRVAPFVGSEFDVFIRLQGPATLSVTYQNIDGGSYVIGAAYSGWYWTQASDQRWRTTGQ